MTLSIDPPLLGDFDATARCWRVMPAKVRLELGDSSANLTQKATLALSPATIAKSAALCLSGTAR